MEAFYKASWLLWVNVSSAALDDGDGAIFPREQSRQPKVGHFGRFFCVGEQDIGALHISVLYAWVAPSVQLLQSW